MKQELFLARQDHIKFIAIDLSLHIVHGLPWCRSNTKQGSVFYIAGEGGAGLYHRIEAWYKFHCCLFKVQRWLNECLLLAQSRHSLQRI